MTVIERWAREGLIPLLPPDYLATRDLPKAQRLERMAAIMRQRNLTTGSGCKAGADRRAAAAPAGSAWGRMANALRWARYRAREARAAAERQAKG